MRAKKVFGYVATIVLVLSVIGVLVFKFCEYKAFKTIKTSTSSVSNKINQQKPFSVLLLGVDTGSDGRIDRGLSDSMMVATLNPRTKQTLLYSVPRDSLAEIKTNHAKKDVQKINAAYEIGKAPVAKKTVSAFLGMPLDYSVTIDMGALKELVDFVGGVTVKTDIVVSFDGQTIPKGTHHLNGEKALAYTRMRYQDPRGDYGRQLRQQEVLMQIVHKLQSPQYMFRIPTLMNKLGSHISTDLTTQQIEKLISHYHQCTKHVVTKQLVGREAWINGSSYQVIDTASLQSASDQLRKNLGLTSKKLHNTETKLNELNTDFFSNPNSTTYNTAGLDTTYYTDNTY
ncbi:LCP family protein [Pediococcus acidilactici]|jgi:LCP family protein required for cell wall assembly|uniref:LCP family protein n=2 Tax=Pediococcus acidilactici TaxID=1254 RepID=UPI001321C28C|nr:LCP family protein [Pediococcus acidilactici]KAF0373677.1 LytR family transcriptional regulator [Pediococcus acidilactici]KAF0384011.1 LytR family transcriptional regulator [Pediococcus acidilactici]KAF0457942.1 LytR family transcriptional regulator [Pediococcus acidilactici]KAF0477365.1 LytR family transcriptional regulator [Pediococcus acidilactici]KAF0538045.1 LytR family transcriptional regulator [Pediococcus acidilactici]